MQVGRQGRRLLQQTDSGKNGKGGWCRSHSKRSSKPQGTVAQEEKVPKLTGIGLQY